MKRLSCISLLLAWACATLTGSADAGALPDPRPLPAARKIDARLLSRALASPDETLSAWVEFVDKGESGPADLSRRLAEAERALSPRNRARRIKALVTPLVDERDLPVSDAYLDGLRAAGYAPFGVSRWFNRAVVRVPGRQLGGIAELGFVARLAPVERARVSVDPVESAVPPVEDARIGAMPLQPTAISYGVKLKEMQQLNVPAVHDSGYKGQGVLVCVLDNGFFGQNTHQATRTIAIPPGHRRDFVQGDTVVTDGGAALGSYHGMRTLSCIGANLGGHLVAAAYGATFALGRTENDTTETPQEMFNWALGAEWADSLGADIISSSLGYFDFDPMGAGGPDYTYADMNGHTTVVTRAAQIAASKGILVVNAVGNEGNTAWFRLIAPSDANGDSVLAVGGVDSTGVIAAFSSRGPSFDGRIKPDLVARGVLNWVPNPGAANDSTYNRVNGTSFATPLLAGLAAVVMSARPTWTPVMVIQALRHTASRFATPDNVYGYGIPNALAVLQDAVVGVPTERPGAPSIALLGANPVQRGRPARVAFSLASDQPEGLARVRVLDATGRAVRTLWSGHLAHGQVVEASWDGQDGARRSVGPGVYWITLLSSGRPASVRVATF